MNQIKPQAFTFATFFEKVKTSRLIALLFNVMGRKVRTTQSTALLVKRRHLTRNEQVTASAAERETTTKQFVERVKRWGKSPPVQQVIAAAW